MPRLSLMFLALALVVTPAIARAQAADSMSSETDTTGTHSSREESRFYFGGSLGLSLSGDILWISMQPMVGYKLTKKSSIGARVRYEYVSDRRFSTTTTSNNYGGSLFTRYRFHPQAFAQMEFEGISLDFGDRREFVPFLYVGGGYVRPLGPKTSLTVEVLLDVLQDDRAAHYRDQGPRINVGIGVGF